MKASINDPIMEFKVFRNSPCSVLFLVLVVSSLSLLFILLSSNPSATIIEPKQQSIGNTDQNSSNFSSSIAQPPIDEDEVECDLFAGRWVRDAARPVYTNSTCTMMPSARNCAAHGKGMQHALWRWKPDGCELRRFDPVDFLSTVRGKKMAFVGDSLARNQMESLLCLLSQAATATPEDAYNGYSKFQTWHYPSHDFTLLFIWAEFLVEAKERTDANGTGTDAFDLHLDRVSPVWAEKLPELHYLIISAGNWFIRKNYLYDDGNLIGCVLCNNNDEDVKDLGLRYAVRRAFRTSFEHISRCRDCDDNLVTLLRTFSSNHFEDGGWFDGRCNRTEPLSEVEVRSAAPQRHWDFRTVQVEEMGRMKEGSEREGKGRMEVLDVTKAMMLRADGHPGASSLATRSDCLHWCLPGPVDMWNDVLLATLKKKRKRPLL
ncbi:protein ALTERED XYLOGLUCAN 4-like [Iris pallida]|uniref:Protein ALTERED XYLOGLUCAN 4-like n=1 Tax=Iris pallida TaxID=29817 RepID=A0AAX6GSL9_IRIPA|nr:protein ALTERED XYLOGLUCAN 4-like [Iris pallida]